MGFSLQIHLIKFDEKLIEVSCTSLFDDDRMTKKMSFCHRCLGMHFPISRVHAQMKKNAIQIRIANDARVFLAAAIEMVG